jgi:hypothetical protein
MLQEEESIPCKKRSYAKSEFREGHKPKWPVGSKNYSRSEVKRQDNSKPADKLDALKAFQCSKGPCFTCGKKWSKKWSRSHKCPSQVPLHIIEELLEVLQI